MLVWWYLYTLLLYPCLRILFYLFTTPAYSCACDVTTWEENAFAILARAHLLLESMEPTRNTGALPFSISYSYLSLACMLYYIIVRVVYIQQYLGKVWTLKYIEIYLTWHAYCLSVTVCSRPPKNNTITLELVGKLYPPLAFRTNSKAIENYIIFLTI